MRDGSRVTGSYRASLESHEVTQRATPSRREGESSFKTDLGHAEELRRCPVLMSDRTATSREERVRVRREQGSLATGKIRFDCGERCVNTGSNQPTLIRGQGSVADVVVSSDKARAPDP